MARYTVTWGDESDTVEATSESEAWNAFVAGHELAYKHPHHHEREITVVDEEEVDGSEEPQ